MGGCVGGGFFTAEVSCLYPTGEPLEPSVAALWMGGCWGGVALWFLRLDVGLRYRRRREEWSIVVRCVHHPAQCVWVWGGRTQGLWRELCLVENQVIAMGASEVLNSFKRDCQTGKSKHRKHCVT